MRRSTLLPLYDALLEIATMRDQARALCAGRAGAGAKRLLSRLDAAETFALRLFDELEAGERVVHH